MHSLDLWQTWAKNRYGPPRNGEGQIMKRALTQHLLKAFLTFPFLPAELSPLMISTQCNHSIVWCRNFPLPNTHETASLATDPSNYTGCAASDNVLVQLWHVGHLVTKPFSHLWSKTNIKWIQGHRMLKDSTQNHLKPHKTQLVCPVGPWLNFCEGPERASVTPFSFRDKKITQGHVIGKIKLSKFFPPFLCFRSGFWLLSFFRHKLLSELGGLCFSSLCTDTNSPACFIVCLAARGTFLLYKLYHSVKLEEEKRDGNLVVQCTLHYVGCV